MSTNPKPDKSATVVPVIEEELVIGKRTVQTGSVQVLKHTEQSPRTVEFDLTREVVDVRHVAVNRVVDAQPPVREEGDTIIVPVVEEEIVVTKRLILKEEIHLQKRRITEHDSRQVVLQHEAVEVRRKGQ